MKNPFRRGRGLKNYENARDKNSVKVTITATDKATKKLKKTTKAFTNKRKHDRLLRLLNNIKQKGQKIMRNAIKNIHIKLSERPAYVRICLFCRAFWRTLRTIAPAVIGAYLVYKYDDTIIVAIGVAGMLYSLLVIVNSSYLAEVQISTPVKKRK